MLRENVPADNQPSGIGVITVKRRDWFILIFGGLASPVRSRTTLRVVMPIPKRVGKSVLQV